MAKTLLEILEDSKIAIRTSSAGRFVAKCPFHRGDNEPSFTVYPNGTYYCFGCRVWGDVVKFLVEYRGLSAAEALEVVGEDYKAPRAEKSKVIKVRDTSKTWEFLWECAEAYHRYLLEMPGALRYLESRGLSQETIEKYKIGYSDGHVLNLPLAYQHQLALEIGLITRSGAETMSHRIVIPSLLDKGQADFLIGRTVISDEVKYLGTRMPKPLMGFFEVRHSPILFLVEGPFDWLALRQWGYPAACLNGNSVGTHKLVLSSKTVIIVPDYDDGEGPKAAAHNKSILGDSAYILDYSELKGAGKLDIGALAERSDGKDAFDGVIRRKLPWIMSMSKPILTKWFPNLHNLTPFQSI